MYGRLKARLACGQGPGDLPEQMERQRKALAALYGGEPQVNTAGKIPDADICFCDEIFKCNDGVLNSLLTAFNERKYTNEGVTYPIPVISFFAASNEIPNFSDPAEKILAALYDRLELKVKTENIQERANRLSVLRSKQSGAARRPVETITLDELLAMQAEVQAVTVPDAINELADDILCDLRSKGVVISDRKFLGYTPVAQAKAWLNGHAAVEPTDLLALKCYLWHLPAERETVFDVLDRFCNNPLQEKINEIRAEAAEALESFHAAGDESGTKALIKLRGEYVRLYQDHQALEAKAQSDAERAQLDELLADLDKNLKTAHDRMSFTHISLKELAVLQ